MIRRLKNHPGQAGNVFFALFGGIALVGLVGVSAMTFMKGPLASSIKLTKINSAENQMSVGARVAAMAAASQTNSGDCDSDGFVEPVEWRSATTEPHPTNGGLIPLTLGMSKKDPWGTEYGYCVWNHGSVTSASGCGANLLAGTSSNLYPVVAIVSAGADKSFTTTCRTYAAADVNSDGDLLDVTDLEMVSKATPNDDDIIFSYTYEEAVGATGGLWNLKSGDPGTAEIAKDIEVTGGATVSGTGSFSGGIILPSSALITCDPSTSGVMARNASGTGLEICDGSAWQAVTGGASSPSGSSDMQLGDETVNATCSAAEIGLMRYNTSGTTGDRDVSSTSDVVTTGGMTYSTPAVVQTSTVGKLTSPPGSVSRSFSTTPTAGNTVIVTFSQYDYGSATPDAFTVTDNQGGTYTLANSHYYYDPGYTDLGASYIYYRSNITTPSPSTYTVTITGSSQFSMQIMEVSGLATSSVIDSNGTGTADIDDTPLTVTSAGTTTQADEIAVSTYMTISGSTGLAIATASSGWTTGGVNNSGSSQVAYGMARNILSSTAQPSITWTASNTSGTRSVGVISTFKAAGTASGPQNTTTTTVSTTKSYSNYAEICNGSSWLTVGSGILNDLTDSADNYTGTAAAAASNSTYSMFLGSGSGEYATSAAARNTALGYQTMHHYAATSLTGTDNVSMGYQALKGITNGSQNVGFGSRVGDFEFHGATSMTYFGSQNPANGGSGNTSWAGPNVAFGYQALNSGKAIMSTTGAGYQAMKNVRDDSMVSSNSTGIGYQALMGGATPSSNTGTNNTAIGATALAANTTGGSNTAVGSAALAVNDTGSSNSGCGHLALTSNTSGSNNVACGYQASQSATVADYNTAIGSGALAGNVAQSRDTAIGYQAMYNYNPSATAGDGSNVAIGWRALYGGSNVVDTGGNVAVGASALYAGSTSSGTNSVAIGANAGYSHVDGLSTLFGYNAGYSDTTTNLCAFGAEAAANMKGTVGYARNVAVGYRALVGGATPALNIGSDNVAVGSYALWSVTSGSNNTAIGAGYDAGGGVYNGTALSLTTGGSNTAIGYNALRGATTGGVNVAIGTSALYGLNGNNTVAIGPLAMNQMVGTCDSNVAVGAAALYGASATCGGYNVAVGYQSLNVSTTGNSNVAVGYAAGNSGVAITTEANNTFLGYGTGISTAGYTNSTALGNGARATASNSIVLGNTAITGIYAQVTSITALSDKRHKKDIQDTDLGLSFINTLHPVSYRFNNGDETLRYGFIAQEIEQSLPENLKPLVGKGEKGIALVTRDDNAEKTYHVNYFEFMTPLIKAVQELDKKVDALLAKFDLFVKDTATELASLLDSFAKEEEKGKEQSDKLDALDKDIKSLEEKFAVAK